MKKLQSMLLIALMVVAGAALAVQNAAAQDDVTVVFFTGAQTTDTLSGMIDDYNANHAPDGVTVDLQEGTWETQSQYDTYSSRFASEDSSFDIISMDVIWPPSFIENGWLEPLDDVFPESEQAKFLEAPILAGTFEGSIYGVPHFHDSGLLYYRTDVLEYAADQGIIDDANPPETWDELKQMALDVTGNADVTSMFGELEGHVWQGKAYEGLMCDFMEILGGTGQTSWLSETDSGFEANLDTQNVRDALAFMADLVESGASPEAVLTYAEEESRAVWNSGDALFHRNWPYAYALGLQTSGVLNGSDSPDGVNDGEQNFAVAPMPAQTAGAADTRTSCLGGWQLGVNAFSENPDEAKEFILWLTQEEQQLTYFAGNGNLPTRTSAYNEQKLIDAGAEDQTYIVDFLPAFSVALPRPVHPDYPAMSAELWEPINSAIAGDITPEEASAQMQTEVETILSEDVQSVPINPLWAFFGIIALGALVRRRRYN